MPGSPSRLFAALRFHRTSMSRHSSSRKHSQRSHEPALESLEPRQLLSPFVVSSFQDSGPGTLRDAIAQANASAGADTISLPKTGTIKLQSALPAITDDLTITAARPVTIDGQKRYNL